MSLAAVVLSILFGGIAVNELGATPDVTRPVMAVVACVGAVSGAFYHRVRRFWLRGAASGLVIALGAFGAERLYSLARQNPLSLEFAVVAALGGTPGVLLYRHLMRRQFVTEEELAELGDASRRTSG